MNIHEYQAKKILKDNGAPVSNGFVISKISEIENKLIQLKGKKFVLKAQIHAGGRGKAGGIKLVDGIDKLRDEAKKMLDNEDDKEKINVLLSIFENNDAIKLLKGG